ncbi:hypothetical protein [Bacillus sinesaloumensis]|uniref:hypothetical protein n=1 Tax=Litchfieldia sinesaloumensis TaxID=1926280 RepID=UPI0009887C11|nr:hypothetical protein [Bacillus sinesaloumensis]
MFRYDYNGKEIIIRFTLNMKNKEINKDYIYRKIISICDKMMDANHGTSFIIEDDKGRLAVGTVQHRELSVISIHHIIDHTQMYIDRIEAKKPS